jgi:hypothetical protein
MRSVLTFLLLATPLLAIQTSQETATGSIEGTVVSVARNLPIEEALVTLQSSSQDLYPFRTGIEPVITGADGKFAFTGLKAGEYSLEIRSNGYARIQYGQKTFPGVGTPIQLTAGEAAKGLMVRMTPTGTVSGRIREAESRQPVSGVPVQLMRVRYLNNGERYFEPFGLARSNDRGEYRLYFVTPGRYFIMAGGVLPRQQGVTSSEISANYPSVYYPGVATTADAAIIEVKPGSDMGGIDFSVGKGHDLYRIRGRVLDSKTGKFPSSARVQLYLRNDDRWEPVPDAFQRYREGGFELPNVAPGSYLVGVDAQEAGYATHVTPVEIADADVDALVISLAPGVPIHGKVSFEGTSLSETQQKELHITLTSPDGLLGNESQLSPTGTNGEATLRFDQVAPGEYRVSWWRLPQGFYVKEARFGGLDAIHSTFRISDREANGLSVVISSKVAVVEGTVTNARLETMAGSLVVLVPDRRDRTELFQDVTGDREGRFKFESIPPGNYRIFAWEALEPNAYFDPELLRQVEQKGKPVQLTESSNQSLTLTAIPTDNN